MIDVTIMKTIRSAYIQNGFALPTVMIASVVMLIVLLSGLVAASSVNVSLRGQYYDRLLNDAINSGAAMAELCLSRNNFEPQWTGLATLRPETLCNGSLKSGITCPTPAAGVNTVQNPECGLLENQNMRTTFKVSSYSTGGSVRTATITATIYMFRTINSERRLADTKTLDVNRALIFKNNPSASRPVKRYWLFGNNAGIDFDTSGTSTSLVNFCAASCYAGEGSTVIARKDGTLQFWTDGRTIWNRNGQPMSNGGGLLANASTTQAAAVFPLGSDETKYVVITNTTENGSTNVGRLYYSVVDMAAPAGGGLGAVTTKNGTLGSTNYSSEALAAAPKSDGSGYWVLTYSPYSLNMVVYSFNNNGVPDPNPISQPANNIGTVSSYNGLGGFGTLNFNADYTKLVMMAGDHCLGGSCSSREGIVRLMSFNSATGQVGYMNHWQSYPDGAGYSADFSPSGNYIYTSAIYPGRLARFTIAGNSSNSTIKSSQTYIGSTQPGTPTSCTGGGQILRAPDDKMYVADCGTNHLSVLSTPDQSSPGYSFGTFSLGSASSTYGLPQMVTIYTPTAINF